MGWVATWGTQTLQEVSSQSSAGPWVTSRGEKKKTVKIGPSGVLKHDNGKEGRLFIVLPLWPSSVWLALSPGWEKLNTQRCIHVLWQGPFQVPANLLQSACNLQRSSSYLSQSAQDPQEPILAPSFLLFPPPSPLPPPRFSPSTFSCSLSLFSHACEYRVHWGLGWAPSTLQKLLPAGLAFIPWVWVLQLETRINAQKRDISRMYRSGGHQSMTVRTRGHSKEGRAT